MMPQVSFCRYFLLEDSHRCCQGCEGKGCDTATFFVRLRPENVWQTKIDEDQLNPDSAVGTDTKREAQSFRSEVDGFLPLRVHRPALLWGDALSLIATA